jgi:type IV pilus assembly protein PilA
LNVFCRRARGFTLIELMAVVAVIAILALIALPSQLDRLAKEQVLEAIKLAELATKRVDAFWTTSGKLPDNNEALDLPSADKIVSNRVSSLRVDQGAVHIVFGNQANGALSGKTLSLRPAVVDDAPAVPITWICAKHAVPSKMTAKGDDRTTLPSQLLPLRCI